VFLRKAKEKASEPSPVSFSASPPVASPVCARTRRWPKARSRQVSGHPAGYMRVNHTHEAGGVAWRTTSELWIVPRWDLIFIIGAGPRQDEKTGTRKEVRGIVNTIKID
jgi:hypothetical protein